MQAGGLDGYLRRIYAGDARPSSLASGMPIWKFNTSQHQALTRSLVDFLLLDGHHVYAVEGPGLRKLLKLAEPRFEPPSRTYIQHVCLNVFRDTSLSFSYFFFLFRLTFQSSIGIEAPEFGPIFEKASTIVTTVRGSSNLDRRLRYEQVESLHQCIFCQSAPPVFIFLFPFSMLSLACGLGSQFIWLC